jgi:hypothetical protein
MATSTTTTAITITLTISTAAPRQERYAVIRHEVEGWGLLYTIQDIYTGKLVYQTGYQFGRAAQRECARLNGHSA